MPDFLRIILLCFVLDLLFYHELISIYMSMVLLSNCILLVIFFLLLVNFPLKCCYFSF